MRIALAQINPIVGDLAGNRAMILAGLEEAKSRSADLVLFPELAVTGYPPEDLLLRPGFVRAAEDSLEEIARSARGIVAVVGTPHFDRDLYNAAAVCAGGEVKAFVQKRFLPNYGVFDEFRYFAPGDGLYLFEHGDTLGSRAAIVGNIVDGAAESIDFIHRPALLGRQDAHGEIERATPCNRRWGWGCQVLPMQPSHRSSPGRGEAEG